MRKIFVVLLFVLSFVLVSCGNLEDNGDLDKVVLAGGDWDSIDLHNNIAQIIIEEGYGYDTEVKMGSTAATFQGLRQGEIHVYMEVWTNTIKEIYEEGIDSGDIVDVSINFDDNQGGFHVPTYVIEGDTERGIEPYAPDLERLEDLKKYPEVFQDPEDPNKGVAYNGPSGWEVTNTMSEKFFAYGLDESFNLISAGSEAALNASLDAAYQRGEPWVGYTWSPTTATAKYDLTILKEDEYDEEIFNETKKTQLPSEDVNISVHKDFPGQAPEVADFLSNYRTSNDLTEAGIRYIFENGATGREAAKWWLKEYEDVWTEWVDEEIAAKVKAAL